MRFCGRNLTGSEGRRGIYLADREGGMEVKLHSFVISALFRVGGQHQSPTTLPPRKKPGAHCTGGWVFPKASVCERKIEILLVVPDFELRIVKLIASRYTD